MQTLESAAERVDRFAGIGNGAHIDAEAYRQALSRFASGVTIVTTAAAGVRHGLTVSAFASLSPDPPLVAVAIDRRHHAHGLLARPDACFAVNILDQQHQALSDRFARVKTEDRFAVGDWAVAATGAPVLANALAWLDCVVHSTSDAGTHTIYIGRAVASSAAEPSGQPLVYWDRSYRNLATP